MQDVLGAKPTWYANQVNGLPALLFNGVNQTLYRTLLAHAAADWTAHFVIAQDLSLIHI